MNSTRRWKAVTGLYRVLNPNVRYHLLVFSAHDTDLNRYKRGGQ